MMPVTLKLSVEWFDSHWPSMLWRCWLGCRKGIWPVKNWVVGVGVVICLELGADLHMAQLMPLPLTVSCFSKIQIGFAFLVPAHPVSPGKRAVKWVCMCVCDLTAVFPSFPAYLSTAWCMLQTEWRLNVVDQFPLLWRSQRPEVISVTPSVVFAVSDGVSMPLKFHTAHGIARYSVLATGFDSLRPGDRREKH